MVGFGHGHRKVCHVTGMVCHEFIRVEVLNHFSGTGFCDDKTDL